MDKYDNLIILQLAIILTIGCIGIECVVLWLTQDFYYLFPLAILFITYYCEFIYYVKVKYYEKKCRKSFDKKKRK